VGSVTGHRFASAIATGDGETGTVAVIVGADAAADFPGLVTADGAEDVHAARVRATTSTPKM
jgi:hypothetical protein